MNHALTAASLVQTDQISLSENKARTGRIRSRSIAIPVLLTVALGAFLSGCAGSPVITIEQQKARAEAEKLAAAEALRRKYGTVLVSLTFNSDQSEMPQTIWVKRQGKRLSKQKGVAPKFHRLDNIAPGSARDTSLFLGKLLPGEYEWKSIVAPPEIMPVSADGREMIGSFSVEAGKLTDLGRVVLIKSGFDSQLGRSKLPATNKQLMLVVAPGKAEVMQLATGGGWDRRAGESAKLVERAITYPQGATGFSELPTGEVVGASRFGTLLVRGRGGSWRVLARTGGMETLLATMAHGQNVVAVGEFGSFLTADRAGNIRSLDRGNLPMGNYFFVASSPDQSRFFIGVQQPKSVTLYASDNLENGDWELVRKDRTKPNFWYTGREVWMWAYQGGLAYASSDQRAVYCHDFDGGKWDKHPSPDKRAMTDVAHSFSGPVGVVTTGVTMMGTRNSAAHTANHCGAGWQAAGMPPNGAAWPALAYKVAESGRVAGSPASRVALKGIAETGAKFWVLPTAGVLKVSRGAHGYEVIRHSHDQGRSWDLEHSSIDRESMTTMVSSR